MKSHIFEYARMMAIFIHFRIVSVVLGHVTDSLRTYRIGKFRKSVLYKSAHFILFCFKCAVLIRKRQLIAAKYIYFVKRKFGI